MRKAFTTVLAELARKDENVFLVTADMGFSFFEVFQSEFPKRTLNVGISEANMIGIASGLALSGKICFTYSIIPFITMRCFEQIRVDMCYQNTNVKLVGSGGGYAYGLLGSTHHAIEDVAIMRSLPNMCVVCPGDSFEAAAAIEQAYLRPGPVYVRLGKNEPNYHLSAPEFKIGKGILTRDGSDLTLISTGTMLKTSMDVADQLKKDGLAVRVISMHTVKPLDDEIVLKAAKETGAIFTLEEHSVIGGLGSAVSELLAEHNSPASSSVLFRRFGIPDEFTKYVGDQAYLLSKYSLTSSAIVSQILKILGNKKKM